MAEPVKAKNNRKVICCCDDCGEAFEAWNKKAKRCRPCRHRARFNAKHVTCKHCGESFKKSRQGGNSRGLFCSPECWKDSLRKERFRRACDRFIEEVRNTNRDRERRAAEWISKIVRKIAVRALEACRVCGGPLPISDAFKAGRPRATCSSKCAKRLRRNTKKELLRKAGMPANNSHARRAKRNGLPRLYGKCVSIPVIGERDRWVCGICFCPIAKRRGSSNSPLAPSLDHIVPLNFPGNTSHGHTPENLQIAHRECNEIKGCSLQHPSLLDSINPREQLAKVVKKPTRTGLFRL